MPDEQKSPLFNMTVLELQDLAERQGIDLGKAKKKADVVAVIEKAQAQAQVEYVRPEDVEPDVALEAVIDAEALAAERAKEVEEAEAALVERVTPEKEDIAATLAEEAEAAENGPEPDPDQYVRNKGVEIKPVASELVNVAIVQDSYDSDEPRHSVVLIQQALAANGLYDGEFDGQAGPKTRAGYAKVQQAVGGEGDEPDRASLTALGFKIL